MIRLSFAPQIKVFLLTVFMLFLSPYIMAETENAEIMPLASKSLLLDITRTNNGWVAVGERGHILSSQDGEHWKQASTVPTRSTLTTVFSLQNTLWAAGHDATIIKSQDGGDTWTLLYADKQADAIMDIVFLDQNHGFAIGAYGQLMETQNGGKDWEFKDLNEITVEAEFANDTEDGEPADNNDYAAALEDLGCYEMLECHLNAMAVLTDQRLMMVGEHGYGFRSYDNGKQWQAIHLPYEGSMFGALVLDNDCVLAYGLRGHAFRSCNFGADWEIVETGTQSTLLGGTTGRKSLVLVGANGTLVRGPRNSNKLTPEILESGVDYTGIASAGRQRGLLTSTAGLSVYDVNKKANGSTGEGK